MSALAVVSKPAAQSTDDLDLVAAVRAGDDRAFELLFARYQGRIAAYVRGMVRDHGRAEDITQEVFIAALRRMRETDREIAFKPWIYEIAKNACIDAFRRARNTSEVSLDAEDALGPSDYGRLAACGAAPDAAVETKLTIDNLCGAFGGISQQHHDILVMREFEGLSYREIGERLGMSRAGVESTLFRARRRLSVEYAELVSGERCLRVRAIADAAGGRVTGLRDRRRLARHISHCQPCRRYALHAGVDLAAVRATPAASKIAALLPLPSFLRKRVDPEDGGRVFGAHGTPALNTLATIDPATVSGWSKAMATAATVAVAGLGAGAGVTHEAVGDFISRTPAMLGLAPDKPAAAKGLARLRSLLPAATAVPATQRGPGGGAEQSTRAGTPALGGPAADSAAGEQAPGAGDTETTSATDSTSQATSDSTTAVPASTSERGLEESSPATGTHDATPGSGAAAGSSAFDLDGAGGAAPGGAEAQLDPGAMQPPAVAPAGAGDGVSAEDGPAAPDSAAAGGPDGAPGGDDGAGNGSSEPKAEEAAGGGGGGAPKGPPEPKAEEMGGGGVAGGPKVALAPRADQAGGGGGGGAPKGPPEPKAEEMGDGGAAGGPKVAPEPKAKDPRSDGAGADDAASAAGGARAGDGAGARPAPNRRDSDAAGGSGVAVAGAAARAGAARSQAAAVNGPAADREAVVATKVAKASRRATAGSN